LLAGFLIPPFFIPFLFSVGKQLHKEIIMVLGSLIGIFAGDFFENTLTKQLDEDISGAEGCGAKGEKDGAAADLFGGNFFQLIFCFGNTQLPCRFRQSRSLQRPPFLPSSPW
jgi:hypothetical protein